MRAYMCVRICAHTVWMHAYSSQALGKKAPLIPGYHVAEHQIALSVVWVGVVQHYALDKTNVHTIVMFCVCVCRYIVDIHGVTFSMLLRCIPTC